MPSVAEDLSRRVGQPDEIDAEFGLLAFAEAFCCYREYELDFVLLSLSYRLVNSSDETIDNKISRSRYSASADCSYSRLSIS